MIKQKEQWYSVVLSMSICIIITIPFFMYVLDVTKPTQEQIDFCSQPTTVCDSYTSLIMIGSITLILIIYFILVWIFDNFTPLQKFTGVSSK